VTGRGAAGTDGNPGSAGRGLEAGPCAGRDAAPSADGGPVTVDLAAALVTGFQKEQAAPTRAHGDAPHRDWSALQSAD